MLKQQLGSRRVRRQLSSEEWGKVFEDWRLSGLSKSGYCRMKNITLSCFDRWYRRLFVPTHKSSADVLSSSEAGSMADLSVGSKFDSILASFIPVKVDGVTGDNATSLKLDIVLLGGHRVCVEGVVWREVVQFLTDSMRC